MHEYDLEPDRDAVSMLDQILAHVRTLAYGFARHGVLTSGAFKPFLQLDCSRYASLRCDFGRRRVRVQFWRTSAHAPHARPPTP